VLSSDSGVEVVWLQGHLCTYYVGCISVIKTHYFTCDEDIVYRLFWSPQNSLFHM